MPPHLFIVRPLPWETLRSRRVTSSAVKEHLFQLLAFYLSAKLAAFDEILRNLAIFPSICTFFIFAFWAYFNRYLFKYPLNDKDKNHLRYSYLVSG